MALLTVERRHKYVHSRELLQNVQTAGSYIGVKQTAQDNSVADPESGIFTTNSRSEPTLTSYTSLMYFIRSDPVSDLYPVHHQCSDIDPVLNGLDPDHFTNDRLLTN